MLLLPVIAGPAAAQGSTEAEIMIRIPRPPPLSSPLEDAVEFSVNAPETVMITDAFQISASARNKLDVPLLLTVELVPRVNICSVTSYSTSSAATDVREHEYLLFPSGTDETLDVFGWGGGLVNGELVALSANAQADAVGDCTMDVVAFVRGAVSSVTDTYLGSMTVHIDVKLPGKEADLGIMSVPAAGGCTLAQQIIPLDLPDEAIKVQAGDVDIFSHLKWKEACADNTDSAIMGIEQRTIDAQGNVKWEPVAGARTADDGVDKALKTLNLAPGTHEFRMRALYYAKWYFMTLGCIGALLLEAAAIGLLLATPPVGTALLVIGILGAVGAGLAALAACGLLVLEVISPVITVQAIDVSSLAHVTLRGVNQIADNQLLAGTVV